MGMRGRGDFSSRGDGRGGGFGGRGKLKLLHIIFRRLWNDSIKFCKMCCS
jgi:hypothetical protein